jgi:hypothetical protein
MPKKTTPADKLRQLIVLALSSDRDGECLSALQAIERILKTNNIDAYRFANSIHLNTENNAPPKPGWRDKVRDCQEQQHRLNDRECAFVFSLARWRGTPTEKQLAWLDHIYENLP